MFKGSIVALITPMDEKGNICQSSLKKLVNYHIDNKTSAIVSVGTTGEFATLNRDEHHYVAMMTLELAKDNIPVIVGTGASSTIEAVKVTKHFNNSGVAGCLAITPYYNLPNQEGLFQHFKAVAECTDLPQIIYNVPSRTGCDILPETVGRLSKISNIIGIKEATKNLSRVNQIKELVSDDFILLSGDDVTALDFMQLGGDGVISVTANIAAKDMAEICKLAAYGRYNEARVINRRLMPLHNKLFIETNPIPVKWACNKLGLISTDILRLPMTKISSHSRNIVTSALKYAGLL